MTDEPHSHLSQCSRPKLVFHSPSLLILSSLDGRTKKKKKKKKSSACNPPQQALLVDMAAIVLFAATTAASFALSEVGSALGMSSRCQAELDLWCNNNETACVDSIKRKDFALPLVARFDRAQHSAEEAWRCYSPSSLSPDLSHYTDGIAYCTEPGLDGVLAGCEAGPAVVVNSTQVFTASEVGACSLIRTPEPVLLSNGTVVLFAQCRVADGSSSNSSSSSVGASISHGGSAYGLEDDFRRTRMVMKSTNDDGKTWGPMRFITEIGTGVGVAVRDATRGDTLVFQYQTLPNANPYESNTLWQKISHDGGTTWTEPVDLTSQVALCNSNSTANMVCGAAGSRIQAANGRLIFAGHNAGSACVWFSDDGRSAKSILPQFDNAMWQVPINAGTLGFKYAGRDHCVSFTGGVTYQTSKPFTGDEVSLAQLGDGSLYMNGRGDRFPWAGHRTGYRSFDGGATWTEGQAVEDLVDVNCEAAMIAVATTSELRKPLGRSRMKATQSTSATTLFLSEPLGPGRFNFALHCSCNGGVSWNSTVMVNRGTTLPTLHCCAAKKMRNTLGYFFDARFCPLSCFPVFR